MTSIVLAGGRGSRLGKQKHSEVLSGRSLISRTIDRVSELSSEILIVISNKQTKSSFRSYSQARTVVDLYPGKSSLGGIFTGLAYSSSCHNLVVACDMPFLNLDLLRYMMDLSADFDVVMPRIGNLREPLHSVYSRDCMPHMEMQLKEGNLKITSFFDLVRVRYVEEAEIDRFDPEHLSFFNINTQADMEKARLIALRETRRGESVGRSTGTQ
jgi:molybdopterin-guanine dinucleotide biosynthesis protein A